MARHPSARPASDARLAALPALAAACALGIVAYGARGPRGSDQFQYVADVETLARGAAPATNLRFAAAWLRSLDGGPAPDLLSHNGPPLHAVAALVPLFGGYGAWIVANVAAHAIVAACVWFVASGLRGPRTAHVATALYLVSPIALWQAMNPLQEMLLSSLLATALLGFVLRERVAGETLLAGTLLTGVATHPLFVPLALVYPAFRVVETRRRPHRAVRGAAMLVLLGAALAVRAAAPGLYPTSFQPSLAAIVASAVPGGSNMYWQLGSTLPTVDAALLGAKLVEALRKHLLSPPNAPFYLYLNASVAALCWLAWRAAVRRPLVPLPLLGALALPIALYVAIVVLQQSHARFAQLVAPASFVAIVAALPARVRGARATAAGAALALVASGTLGALYARELRTQAAEDARGIATLAAAAADLPADARLATLGVPGHGAFAWAVRPRPVLVLRGDLMTETDVTRALDTFAPVRLYVPADAVSDASPGTPFDPNAETRTIDEPFGAIVGIDPVERPRRTTPR